MKPKLLNFSLLFFSITLSFSQQITGVVTERNNQPIEFANIVLYNNSSKEIITGVVSNQSGAYVFSNLLVGSYYIEVSMLGFETKKSDVFELLKDVEINFLLNEVSQTLNEVVIKSKRPVIRQTAEKLIIDLEKSEMINSNLQDVMKRIPGVMVTNNGISFAGKNNIRILINGKTTNYMDIDVLLRDMPADNIAKVELVEQPGAEFDAEGSGAVINIILKKNLKLGTHGNLVGWLGEDQGFEYGTSASIASYKNKLNWQASAGYSSPTWREDLFIKRIVGEHTYDQATIEPYNPKSFRTSASIDYYLHENHSVGVGLRRNTTNSDRVSSSSNIIRSQMSNDVLISENSFNRDQVVFNINPYYEFKKNAHKFTTDFNFIDYTNSNINTIFATEGNTIPYVNQQYLQDGNYQIKTIRVDYSKMFSEALKLSFGSKYSKVKTNNNLQSFNQNNSGDFIFDAKASNQFLIDETIFALYTKLNITKEDWSFSGGLRFENSKTKGVSSSNNETKERKISKLFPSASISKKINDNLGVSVSYSYRIRRPSYNTLNSFVTYYDPLSSEKGNKNLKPSFSSNYQFNLTYDSQPFFTIGYSQTTDEMFQFISQDDTTAQITRSTINLTDSKNWNFRLFGPLSFIKGVEGYTGFILNHNKFQSKELSPELLLKKWSLFWFTQASYELPWGINVEVNGHYGTGALEGQLDVQWLAGLDASFGKKFLDNKLKVNLSINNILNRAFVSTINYDNIMADVVSDQSRQNVQLRLSYNFGSQFGKRKNRKIGSKDEENRIENNN